jgi:hypothetical protein
VVHVADIVFRFDSRDLLSYGSVFGVNEFIVDLIELMHSLSDLFVILLSWFVAGMQTKVSFGRGILIYFTHGIGIQSAIDNILDLDAE